MQRPRCDHSVVGVLLLEILDPDPAEAVADRGERVDPERVVARSDELGRQLALAAADLEHACRRGRQALADELGEGLGQQSLRTVA